MLVIDETKLKNLPEHLQKQVRRVAIAEFGKKPKTVTPPLSLEDFSRLRKGTPIAKPNQEELGALPTGDIWNLVKNYWWVGALGFLAYRMR